MSCLRNAVWQRASYSLGSHIGADPKSFEPKTDPYLATFMAPQRAGTNLRMAFLPSTKEKAVREAFDADAGFGLNFTVASNWKRAARQSIFGKLSTAEQGETAGGRDEAFGGRDLADFEDEIDAIWRNSIGGVLPNKRAGGGAGGGVTLVPRGKTAGERRQMVYAADGNMMTKSYQVGFRLRFKF